MRVILKTTIENTMTINFSRYIQKIFFSRNRQSALCSVKLSTPVHLQMNKNTPEWKCSHLIKVETHKIPIPVDEGDCLWVKWDSPSGKGIRAFHHCDLGMGRGSGEGLILGRVWVSHDLWHVVVWESSAHGNAKWFPKDSHDNCA